MIYDYHCASTDHHDYLMMNTVILMVDDNKFKTIMMMHRMLLFPTHKALLPCNRNHRLPRPPRWPHSYGRWKVIILLVILTILTCTIFLVFLVPVKVKVKRFESLIFIMMAGRSIWYHL